MTFCRFAEVTLCRGSRGPSNICKCSVSQMTCALFMERIVLRLGAFHTVMTFFACIGTRYRDAGLEDILIESEVLAAGSVDEWETIQQRYPMSQTDV